MGRSNILSKFRFQSHPYLPMRLTFIVGVGLCLILSLIMWEWDIAHIEALLGCRADNLAVTFQSSIDKYLQSTKSVSAFYEASNQVTRSDFKAFSQPFLEKYPRILGMDWTIPVWVKNHFKRV